MNIDYTLLVFKFPGTSILKGITFLNNVMI